MLSLAETETGIRSHHGLARADCNTLGSHSRHQSGIADDSSHDPHQSGIADDRRRHERSNRPELAKRAHFFPGCVAVPNQSRVHVRTDALDDRFAVLPYALGCSLVVRLAVVPYALRYSLVIRLAIFNLFPDVRA